MCATRRQSWTAGRFRASSEMIKHYDRFIDGHDSTVNHRRKQAMTREAMRDPLTTRCHSRVVGRLDADCLRNGSFISFFFSVFLGNPEWDNFRDIHDIRAHAAGSREFIFERKFSRLSLWSGNCWTDRSISDWQRGNLWRNYVRDRVIGPVVVAIAHTSHVRDYYIDESNYLAPQIISMALLMLRTSSSIGSVGSIACSRERSVCEEFAKEISIVDSRGVASERTYLICKSTCEHSPICLANLLN